MPTYARRRSSSSFGSPRERRCGKTPSSMPVRNTTGNSRPLAVCRVISVTTPPPSPSASGIWSASATSATCSRNSQRASPSRARPRSNSRATADQLAEVLHAGLVLRVAGRLRARRGSRVRSSTASSTSAGGAVGHDARSSSIRATNSLDRVGDRGAMPGASSARAQRLPERMRSRLANASTHASARSPIPRLGTLRMRRRPTVSPGWRAPAGRRAGRGSPCARRNARRRRPCTAGRRG